MLLGIVLHATLSFIEGFWPVRDISLDQFTAKQTNPFALVLLAIHGFRMPLFFLLSGFFTTMLWRRRGLAALLLHRVKRIAIPVAIGVVTVVPLVNWLSDRAWTARFGAVSFNAIKTAESSAEGSTEGLDSWLSSFHHLWFLWFLLWLMAGFALVALLVQYLETKRHAGRASSEAPKHQQAGHQKRGRATNIWLWLMLPTSLVFALISKADRPLTWGPHTSAELIPDFWILAYYGAFFAFGALLFSARTTSGIHLRDTFGKRGWHWVGAVSLAAMLVGWGLTYEDKTWLAATVVETIHTWGMAYALMGLFAVTLKAGSYWIRYMSDASYWMYIAHLPLLIFLQDIVDNWEFLAGAKFLGICVVCVGLLLLTYRFGVRYTPIGWLLNGRR